MPTHSRASRVLAFAVSFLFVITFAPGQTTPPVPEKIAQSASAPASEVSKYVGAETCKPCHEDIYNAWGKTPHWKTTLNKEAGPSHQGCEGCHGPGADHVAGGGDVKMCIRDSNSSRAAPTCAC